MRTFRNFSIGLRNLFGHSRAEAELDDEVRGYMEASVAEKMRSGITREAALRDARLEMGSVDAVKDRVRDVGWEQVVESLSQDMRFGLRVLRKAPTLTLVAVLTLALGIGANSAMFGIVYGLLYRPLPFPQAERIAAVHMNFSPQNARRGTMCLADFVDWRQANTAFEKVALYRPDRFTITGDAQAEEVVGAAVTADYFSIVGRKPILGRTFKEGEDAATAPGLVVISESLWRRRFGGDAGVIGRVVEVNGSDSTIVGVLKEDSGFPRRGMELWRNLPLKVTRRGPFSYRGIGRLRPGISLQQAQAETDLIGRNIERANPYYSRLSLPVESLRDSLVGDMRPALWMMLGAVFTVLLIAIVNIANLLLARATTRGREMAVRLSLGASRERVVQQLLTESILLSLAGATVGLGLAWAVVRIFRAVNPAKVPLVGQVQLDWNVLLFTLVISVGAGVLFGVAPAFQSAKADPQSALKSGGRSGTADRVRLRARGALVVTEIALSLVLLVAAGLLLRSFVILSTVHAGTTAPPANVLALGITPGSVQKIKDRTAAAYARVAFYDRVLEKVSQLPGVRYAAISDTLPPNIQAESDTFSIAGQPWTDQAFPSTTLPRIGGEYFRALGVPLLRGRYFGEQDTPDSQPVVIINQALAKRYFAGTDPIGQKLKASSPTNTDPYMDIVGVVGDMKFWGLDSEFKPAYFVPYRQNPGSTSYVVVQSTQAAAALAPMIEREVHDIDRDAVVRQPVTLDKLLGDSVAEPRFRTFVLAAFGTLALVLAAVGIYGVIAYSVTQRTQEIGIRMALGAQRFDIVKMVIRYGGTLAAAGIGFGILGSLATSRVMSGFLFATKASDPVILAGGCGVLLAVAITAALVPAVRATRIDLQEALRQE